jgi:hypothetical protein
VYGYSKSLDAEAAAKTENNDKNKIKDENTLAQNPLRDWFDESGILICRPASASKNALGVALKGGHNAEQHNHNDVGSFVVALGKTSPLLDPGNEVYTKRTFSGKRYESNVLNSFGHPVPRVAGQLQVPGRKAAAKVLKTEFTDTADTYVIDITSAYDVKELKKLVRTFVFSREGRGTLTVTDEVEFDSPQKFGTALITFSPWKQINATKLSVGESPNDVLVELTVVGGTVQLASEEIHEDLPEKKLPVRLGIDFAEPVTKASIGMTIQPK